MTSEQALILALIVLAAYVWYLASKPKAQSQPPTIISARVIESPTPATLDPNSLAQLLHQTVQARGQVRAIERHVESMIEGEAMKAPISFSPATAVPKA